jgi:hypothetical protein
MQSPTHPFTGFFVCRDNYLADPETVIEISKSPDIEWRTSRTFRGKRSSNLLLSENPSIQAFASNLGNRMCYDVFPGIKNIQIDMCFHEYDVLHSEDDDYNTGWIHVDYPYCVMAGMIYLEPDELSMDTGTSIFYGHDDRFDSNPEMQAVVHEFNTSSNRVTDAYKKIWKENKDSFPETIRAANVYNRLIGYDANSNHRTNSFKTSAGKPRLCLLFYITQYEFGDINER